MSTVVLRFDVPDELRHIFDHELDLVLNTAEPLLNWLRSNGGGLDCEGATGTAAVREASKPV
ncbi:hypothetical protein SAMN04244553_3566 [Nocardia amikacinitolerans]|uniref:Uncharacterized protein n=1 Tax=Nocardia amikacinitolerans TaxID=756689 RepID=A0A285LFV9_9NOCA|nr:hypothetical protein SAMN04244553_3566 [Nocardia amikacinitolerans]